MRVFGMITTQASSAYTDHAISTFFAHTELRSFDCFYLIDNDKSYSVPSEFCERIKLIQPETPQSFAVNVNQIMTKAFALRADLFFLNNDLIFPEGWLQPLLSPEHAILSPLSNREVQHESTDFIWKNALSIEDYLPRVPEFNGIAARHLKTLRGQEQVLSLPFFCVKMPYTVYTEIGPLDERYGRGGGEDYDYCLRAALQDIPVKYVAQSFVLHFSGKSTWSGGEDAESSIRRRDQYSDEFEKKWGRVLREILIEENKNILNEHPAALELFSKGKTAEAITFLRGVINES